VLTSLSLEQLLKNCPKFNIKKPKPKEIMTDTAGYSDIIFGLFGLLGYQFSPRLADIGESRLWRLDPKLI
jgi:TnpA family transposase